MRKTVLFALLIFLSAIGITILTHSKPKVNNISSEMVASITSFSQSEDEESNKAFDLMMDVLTHPRCVNCHPSDNIPKQGMEQRNHNFMITRNNAEGATNCQSCHQSSNNDYSGVPGAPDWALAPHTMRWEGLSRIEIAQSMLNRKTNGNRSLEDLMHHLTEHELVLWAWDPGKDASGKQREAPPVAKEDYIVAVKKWIELGTKIPKEN